MAKIKIFNNRKLGALRTYLLRLRSTMLIVMTKRSADSLTRKSIRQIREEYQPE